MPDAMQSVALVVLVLIGNKALDFLTKKYFKKIDTDYVTPSECKECRDECRLQRQLSNDELNRKFERMADSLSELRGLMLVIAVKAGVSPEDLKGLTR